MPPDTRADQISVADIVLHLRDANRFSAAFVNADKWSVLDHSFLSLLVFHRIKTAHAWPDVWGFYCAAHDLHEYLTGDIPAPIKRFSVGFIGSLERRLDESIFESLGMPCAHHAENAPLYEAVHHVDRVAQIIEVVVTADSERLLDYLAWFQSYHALSDAMIADARRCLSGHALAKLDAALRHERLDEPVTWFRSLRRLVRFVWFRVTCTV